MMTHETLLKLSDPLLRGACDLAQARQVTLGQVIRDALAAELRRNRRPGTKVPAPAQNAQGGDDQTILDF